MGDVISGEARRYDRGVWFNSAKFYDLEWQTYGQVPPTAVRPPSRRDFWWRHPQRRIGLRIATEAGAVVGVNAMGLRQRHVIWERWIAERRALIDVLPRLSEANFDPEFFRRHEGDIARSFEETCR